MNILYLSDEIEDGVKDFDPACIAGQIDKVIQYTPPLKGDALQTIFDQPDNLFIIAARDPYRSSSQIGETMPVIFANQGINPGNIGYIDLDHIFAASASRDSVINRLQIHTKLTLVKLAHTTRHPKIVCRPEKELFMVGIPTDLSFVSDLQGAGIAVSALWSGTEYDVKGTPVSLSGTPGNYQITLDVDGEKQTRKVGAVAIFIDALSTEQRKELAEGFILSLKKDRLHLLPNQLRVSQGVKIISSDTPIAPVSHFFCSLLSRDELPHYVEDPLIDHQKCGLCGTCVKTCLFHASAIEEGPRGGVSTIYADYCVACGNCVTACPTQARDLPSYSYDYFSAVWRELKEFKGGQDGLKILVIYCESNGQDAVRALARQQLPIPSACLFFRIGCGARVDTQFIPDSFRAGFDGVALVVCAREECGNVVGSLDLERRLNLYRKVMQASGIDTGRMRILPVASDRLETVGDSLEKFAAYLLNLKQDKKLFHSIME
jgi:coenzyme F420-reducing hydrogenase delta subunit/Pyruvate/2-oxoacid:ferredoxin oxidoreductase delta subunit